METPYGTGFIDNTAGLLSGGGAATSTVAPSPSTVIAPTTNSTPTIKTPSGPVSVDNMGNVTSAAPATGDSLNPTAAEGNDSTKVPAAFANAPAGSYQRLLYEAQQAKLANSDAASKLTSSSNNGFISSSSSIVNNENDISNQINGAVADDPATTKAHNDYLAFLDTQSANLSSTYQSNLAALNGQFDEARTKLETQQKDEDNATNVSLQRTGGYLGEGSSQVGAMIKLGETHKYEVGQLEAKRADALNAAVKAKNDGDFEVAKLKLQEAQQFSKDVQDRKDKYFSNMLQLQQNQREEGTFQMNKAQDTLKGLSSLSTDQLSKVPQETLNNIDKTYGVPGFAKNAIAVAQAAAKVKTQADALDTQKKMLDLLQSIPQGKSWTAPDGTTYTGMGKIGDIDTFHETINGKVTLVTYNKATGVINKIPIGNGTGGSEDIVKGVMSAVDRAAQPLDPSNPTGPKYLPPAAANKFIQDAYLNEDKATADKIKESILGTYITSVNQQDGLQPTN